MQFRNKNLKIKQLENEINLLRSCHTSKIIQKYDKDNKVLMERVKSLELRLNLSDGGNSGSHRGNVYSKGKL